MNSLEAKRLQKRTPPVVTEVRWVTWPPGWFEVIASALPPKTLLCMEALPTRVESVYTPKA